jgi:hypothetical protein
MTDGTAAGSGRGMTHGTERPEAEPGNGLAVVGQVGMPRMGSA